MAQMIPTCDVFVVQELAGVLLDIVMEQVEIGLIKCMCMSVPLVDIPLIN